jgi:hypothetical protein
LQQQGNSKLIRPALVRSGTASQVAYTLPHPIWKNEYVDAVKITHLDPENFTDKLALNTVRLMRYASARHPVVLITSGASCLFARAHFRFNFDWMSGYSWGKLTEADWLRRIIFLETVAGVPGSVAAILRHLHSLRRLKRDHGWIHTLLVPPPHPAWPMMMTRRC